MWFLNNRYQLLCAYSGGFGGALQHDFWSLRAARETQIYPVLSFPVTLAKAGGKRGLRINLSFRYKKKLKVEKAYRKNKYNIVSHLIL